MKVEDFSSGLNVSCKHRSQGEKIIARKIPPFLTARQDKASSDALCQGRERFSSKTKTAEVEAREVTRATEIKYLTGRVELRN